MQISKIVLDHIRRYLVTLADHIFCYHQTATQFTLSNLEINYRLAGLFNVAFHHTKNSYLCAAGAQRIGAFMNQVAQWIQSSPN